MKKRVYLLIMLLITFWSCYEQNFDEAVNPVTTSGFEIKQKSGVEVGIQEVNAYMELLHAADSTLEVESITPYIIENDTVMYIVNYKEDKGWKIISGDKRTTAVLASAADGQLDVNTLHPGIVVWLESIGKRIIALKNIPQIETAGGDGELWQHVAAYVEGTMAKQKKAEEAFSTRTGEYHWELMSISEVEIGSTLHGPYTCTRWGQYDPWNRMLPDNSPTLSLKCPAGCLAVAGSQMLYYLHYKIGVPQYTYKQGSCKGWASSEQDQSYTFQFSNPDEKSWDWMPLERGYPFTQNVNLVNILIAHVGHSIKTIYTPDGSSALNSNLVKYMNDNNISCRYENYNSDQVINSLNNEMPVIVTAVATSAKPPKRHSWIIDGYEVKRYKVIYTYGLADERGNFLDEYMEPDQGQVEKDSVKDDGGFGEGGYTRDSALNVSGVLPILMGSSTTRKTWETTTYKNFLIMNWGWDGRYKDERYALLEKWTSDYVFENGETMIIGFSKKN